MNDEARPPGGLDANGAPRKSTTRGARWGRRTPYGIRRDAHRDDWRPPVQHHPGATYAADNTFCLKADYEKEDAEHHH